MDVGGQHGCMFVCGPQIMQNGGMVWPGSYNDNFPYPITHGTAACQQEEITMLFRIQMLDRDTVSSVWDLFQQETRCAYAALLTQQYPESPLVQPHQKWKTVGTWSVPVPA